MSDPNSRVARLTKQLDLILHGKTPISPRNYALFLEAICAQPDAATCIGKVIASKNGLPSLQAAMRIDLTPDFCNGAAADFLRYISSPDLATIGGGDILRRVLLSVVEPPFFLTALVDEFKAKRLQEKAELSLSWLLLQLVLLPSDQAAPYHDLVDDDPPILDNLLRSSQQQTRTNAEKIKLVLDSQKIGVAVDVEHGPGGRHDNDKVNFREISILPTADEITSGEPAFLRPSAALEDPSAVETRVADYLDNHFRLLREDMIYELRDEMEIALKKKRANSRNFAIDGLRLLSVHHERPDDTGTQPRRERWAVSLQMTQDFAQLSKVPKAKRKGWFLDNKRVLKHRSMACLLVNDELTAFATINRNEELLAQVPATVVLHLEGEATTVKALLKLKAAERIKLVQIDTALFAYEPVLKALQESNTVPLSRELLFWNEGVSTGKTSSFPPSIVSQLRANPTQDLKDILRTTTSIKLDKSQSASLLSGLTETVSLIQGPPGTGKSFIGALLAKALHDFAGETILVVCYTNHALDQFLEDLLNIGIPQKSMVRLGGKSTARTAPLSLQNLQKEPNPFRFTRNDWTVIDSYKESLRESNEALRQASVHFMNTALNAQAIMEYLEFEDPEYYDAFQVPSSDDGMQRVGKKNKALDKLYLFNQWTKGWNAGLLKDTPNVLTNYMIWQMPVAARQARLAQWKEALLQEQVVSIHREATVYNRSITSLDRKFEEGKGAIIRSKQIIGCTTTAAAMYRDHLNAASPGVLLVEEAGEILESHVLTSLAQQTKQLILIGDHKQLRPKVNNYRLTVEKGEGYDLNRSLFERLVIKGYPHETLSQQHRMRPEISALVRHLTYPDLTDAPSTQNRPDLRGVRDNVVFIHHGHPEDDLKELRHADESNGEDVGRKASKTNKYEVDMVLKILRYLGQNGYGTDKIVILTPYLGQLRALQTALQTTVDPILNDLDSADLVRAGLVSEAAANVTKSQIKLATIDNYQGEESDIVIASLTRSNPDNTIGFMSSSERLNVMLSRARDALILIGNAHTFQNARRGGEAWRKLFEMLKAKGHIYDGLPAVCVQHPDRIADLRTPDEFDQLSPDGGCTQPCGSQLKCGHLCPQKCHQISDHSKMPCEQLLYDKCLNGHQQRWKCRHDRPDFCLKCEKDKKAAEKKAKEDFALQEKRDREQREHDQELAKIEAEIVREREAIRDAQLAQEREHAIQQKMRDLRDAASLAAQATSSTTQGSSVSQTPPVMPTLPANPAPVTNPSSANSHPPVPQTTSPTPQPSVAPTPPRSEAKDDWERQKMAEGVSNDAIDAIMEMAGLERVKAQVLDIKTAVDTAKRQGMSLSKNRYNLSCLGNPGTGKTTIARHYARFLASVQVLPGNEFVETTGSRLANDGVAGVKKQIEDVLKAGGGTIFVDEAYQLTSQHNFSGGQVLDFLLAEMENNVGKIVFIFAGYNKEMEKFFEHNPGLTSRVPYTLQFDDYRDEELLGMLESIINKRFSNRMKVDNLNGIRGLYGRIVVRRLGRGRGRPGFGNARALENILAKILERQARRLKIQRQAGQLPDDLVLVKEDLIGPDPANVMVESDSYKKLQGLIGLVDVKKSVANLFAMVKTNYEREILEKAPHSVSLNRVFLGPPGTGKTTVAKLYGQILAELGMLSNGEVIVKNPADFVGSALGQSESQTKGILASTVGKVLVIDEAYMLYNGSGGSGAGGSADPYKTAVIDTIVAEVQSVPGEDRCVLLLGYKDQMEEMFQNVNPGLSRRFAIEDAFQFINYSDPELLKALEWKLKDQDLTATESAKRVAIEVLSRLRNRPNFGNIGEVENLLSKAKVRYQERQATLPSEERSPDAAFEPQDFDPDFNRGQNAASNLAKLFEDVVGCEEIVAKLQSYQRVANKAKSIGKDPRDLVPTNFVFKGPPGTGKTTTARKIGQVYCDMGFLSSPEVIECSASDLVGQYVGQTGPKTKKLFEKALGRVLFVDEAYRLGEGHFAKEAMDELVGLLTQESFRGKLIVVLAGYDEEMNSLLAVNTGLSSRFPDEIIFKNMSPSHCLEVLKRALKKQDVRLDALDDAASSEYARMAQLFNQLSQLPSWGNARDVQTMAKQMVNFVFVDPESTTGSDGLLVMQAKDAISRMENMLQNRRARATNVPTPPVSYHGPPQQPTGPQAPPAPPATRTTQTTKHASPPPLLPKKEENEDKASQAIGVRDAGVSDTVWAQLQADKRAEELALQRREAEMSGMVEAFQRAAEQERVVQQALAREEQKQRALAEAARAQKRAFDQAQLDELKRRREEARLRDLKAREERARIAAALEARRKEEERVRKEEARVQQKLREMGVCVAGFQWIKQSSGYRCAGGSHFIGNSQLGI